MLLNFDRGEIWCGEKICQFDLVGFVDVSSNGTHYGASLEFRNETLDSNLWPPRFEVRLWTDDIRVDFLICHLLPERWICAIADEKGCLGTVRSMEDPPSEALRHA